MNRLEWDKTGEKLYETGVDHVVLYPYNTDQSYYGPGVVWNGITAVNESPDGAEPNAFYADNIKYANLMSAEEYKATIEAYMYPDEWAACDGSAELATGVKIGQQNRKVFGLSYRTVLGNDEENNNYGYKLHLIYGGLAAPSEKNHETINDSPELQDMSWEMSTTPVNVTGYKPTSSIEIDSTKADSAKLAALEDILYGVNAADYDTTKSYKVGDYAIHTSKLYIATSAATGEWDASKWSEIENPGPRLPLPDEIADIFA